MELEPEHISSWPAFAIGLLIGMLIILLIMWPLYSTRTFVFSNCASQQRVCMAVDYYNDPAEAIANGADVNNILFLNAEDKLFYKRVQKNTNCTPAKDQTIPILEPQYCDYTTNIGSSFEAKNTFFGSDFYLATGMTGISVTASESCHPVSSSGLPSGVTVASGIPLIKWDPAPQSS